MTKLFLRELIQKIKTKIEVIHIFIFKIFEKSNSKLNKTNKKYITIDLEIYYIWKFFNNPEKYY